MFYIYKEKSLGTFIFRYFFSLVDDRLYIYVDPCTNREFIMILFFGTTTTTKEREREKEEKSK